MIFIHSFPFHATNVYLKTFFCYEPWNILLIQKWMTFHCPKIAHVSVVLLYWIYQNLNCGSISQLSMQVVDQIGKRVYCCFRMGAFSFSWLLTTYLPIKVTHTSLTQQACLWPNVSLQRREWQGINHVCFPLACHSVNIALFIAAFVVAEGLESTVHSTPQSQKSKKKCSFLLKMREHS